MLRLFNRMVVSVFLLTALMVGMAGGVVAQARFGLGTSFGFGGIDIAGTSFGGGTFMLNARVESPLNENGLSISCEPGLFATSYAAQVMGSSRTLYSYVYYSGELSYTHSGIRLPVLLKQRVGNGSFGGGAYVDMITSSKIKLVFWEAGAMDLTNKTVFGLVGQGTYDFKWAQGTMAVTLPLSDLYQSTKSTPVTFHLGLATTF